jgi:hypothetical protein
MQYGAILVAGSESPGQSGFLIEPDGGGADRPGHGGVLQEAGRAEQQRLAQQMTRKPTYTGLRT